MTSGGESGATLRLEATLARVPVFALAVRGSASLDGYEYRQVRRRGDRAVESVIRTERDAATPYPGPLSRRVHTAILGVVADAGFPFANPVEWTWRDLCRRMGLPCSGRRDAELKAALRATWGLKLHGLAGGPRPGAERETWRRLYAQCEFLNEPRPDGSLAGRNRLWLAPWYLESLNALHAVPIDYALWKRLEAVGPIASRLYEYLSPAFYKREALELAYDRLATALPVAAEARRSHAVRQLGPGLMALEAEGVLASFAWDAMKGTGRPKLVLARGPRLAPPATDEPAGPSPTAAAPPLDPEAPARLAAEFYRLLGKPARPLRSDLAVAGSILARYGVDGAAAILPVAVRLLKARFRNAETMGALVRYVDEAAGTADVRRDDQARQTLDAQARGARQKLDAEANDRRKAAWDALPDDRKQARREQALREHPGWRRHPALVEAQCVETLAEETDRRP